MAAWRHFGGTVLSQPPGVRETRSCAAMDEVNHRTQLPRLPP